jgi:hypothetical protein
MTGVVTGLPIKMRQVIGEVHRVLPGPAAYLQNVGLCFENLSQHVEYWPFVVFASL